MAIDAMDQYRPAALLYDALIVPLLLPVHRAVLLPLRRYGCAAVADLCCGTGAVVGLAAHSGMTAFGIDLSPAMLEMAAQKHPMPFIRADATALPLRNDSLHGATICFALHEKPRHTARNLLAEAQRIVRPGGVIVIADYRTAPDNGWWTAGIIGLVERVAGTAHHAHYREYMHKGGTEGLLREAGIAYETEQIFFNGWAGLYIVPVEC